MATIPTASKYQNGQYVFVVPVVERLSFTGRHMIAPRCRADMGFTAYYNADQTQAVVITRSVYLMGRRYARYLGRAEYSLRAKRLNFVRAMGGG